MSKKRKKNNYEIEPDEIFLDSSNIPDFNVDQFEGRIEKPISQNTILFLAGFFVLVSLIFAVKVGSLQINQGEEFAASSENNRLHHTPIFSERGVIYDRNNVELAWNSPNKEGVFSKREYKKAKGLSHLVGYVD